MILNFHLDLVKRKNSRPTNESLVQPKICIGLYLCNMIDLYNLIQINLT